MLTLMLTRLRGLALLFASLSVLACSVLVPAARTPPAAITSPLAPPTSAAQVIATPRPTRTPVVFLTNTAIPRLSPTPAAFVEENFGLDRRETLVLLGLPPAPAALDPATTTGAADGYVGHLFSGLVRLGPDLQVEPDLAESWTVSPDGLVYTFVLRAGLAFASGQPLTAAHVQSSWERAADPATNSPTAAAYLGDIAGLNARLDGSAASISGLTVVDDRTFVVTLAQPRVQFLARLTYPVAFVVHPDNVAAGPLWVQQPNASGPFVLRSFVPDRAMLFARNPGYHTPAGVAYVAYLFAPIEMASLFYESGEIDIGFVDAQTAARVRDEADPLHVEWRTVTSLCTLMFRLDLNNPPLDDPQVRLALALSLDRAALRDNFGGVDTALAETILPPGLPGYSADLPRNVFNADVARAALAASRYAGALPPIILADPGTPDQPSPLGAALVAMWRENLGIEVTIQTLASPARPPAGKSLGHILVYSWCADYPDPENFLEVLFHSSSPFNLTAYANPQVDAWLNEARGDVDPAHRFGLLRQAEHQILTDVAVIPWLHPTYERMVKPYVKGFVLEPMGVPIIHRVTLEWPAE